MPGVVGHMRARMRARHAAGTRQPVKMLPVWWLIEGAASAGFPMMNISTRQS